MIAPLVAALDEWDRATFLAINAHGHHPVLDVVMPVVTLFGLGHVQVFVLLAAAVLAAWRAGELGGPDGGIRALGRSLRSRRFWLAPVLVAMLISGLASNLIKEDERLRPWWFYSMEQLRGRFLDVEVRLVPGELPQRMRGFPSGHTTTSVAIACTLFLLRRRLSLRRRVVAGLWLGAGAVAFSRIYLATHWPLDIVGGIGFGVLGALASVLLLRRMIAAPAAAGAVAEAPGRA
ncbi:MAG TPA: phosphatase PAP2 family protein [Chthonomonadales bacterium]|nr:phosphatase PAP2 family protein [Chthonomonadales bacterium]